MRFLWIASCLFSIATYVSAQSLSRPTDWLGKPIQPCQDDAQIDPTNPYDPNNWPCPVPEDSEHDDQSP